MDDPVVSIVTPSYNQANFIEDNILSVKNVNNDMVEHIIIDGDSDDETISILEKHKNEYNLRWISEEDSGQVEAVNKGIDLAQGKWIGWQNSDDYYTKDGLQTLINHAKSYPDKDVIYGDLKVVDEKGHHIKTRYHTISSKFIQRYFGNFTANQTMLFKNSVASDVFPLSKEFEYALDIELFWRLLNSELKLKHIPKEVGAVRFHNSTKTSNFSNIQKSQGEKIDRKMYQQNIIEENISTSMLFIISLLFRYYLIIREDQSEVISHEIGRFIQNRM